MMNVVVGAMDRIKAKISLYCRGSTLMMGWGYPMVFCWVAPVEFRFLEI